MSKAKMSRVKDGKKITNEKPITLSGVDFKKLMAAFLKVDPNEKKAKKRKKDG
jgi:hypothetical protein